MPEQTNKASEKVYKRLLAYLRPLIIAFALAILANIGYSALDALLIKLLKPLIDDGFIHKDARVIALIPIVLPLLFLARGSMNFLSAYLMAKVGRSIVMRMRQEVFAHYLQLPLSYFKQTTSGEALSKIIYNIDQVTNAATQSIIDLVRESSLLLALLIVMLTTSWQLTLVLLAAAPFILLIITYVNKRSRRLCKKSQNAMGKLAQFAEEALGGLKIIKLFSGYEYENARFSSAVQEVNSQECKIAFTNALSSPIVQLLCGCALAIIVAFALRQTGESAISAGAFASIASCLIALLRPLKRISNLNVNIQRGLAGAESFFAVIDERLENDSGYTAETLLDPQVNYRGVSFNYPNDNHMVLKNIDLEVKPGEMLALVGASGSGKSTCINLLPRFYEDYQGEILIDKRNIRDLGLGYLRRHIAVVDQNVLLFNDTIANNIAYGSLHQDQIDSEKVLWAAKLARVTEFTDKLKLGLQTQVGGNGMLLSGGQRQRIAIARALYKGAPIIIFDEATSALDSAAEHEIQLAIEELRHQKTIIVIAHRLSTIRNADKIAVFNRGEIVEFGTHQELINLNNNYSKLYKLQFKEELA